MTTTADAEATEQPVGLIITAVAVTLFLASMGQTIVSTALPAIVGELGGLEHLTWVVIAYLLASTVVSPIYGKLGDLFGRKIVLQVAIIIFLVGATLSAMASSMNFLIVARAIQGLGGGGLLVVAMTVVADVIPARQRGKIQGVFGAVFGLSTVGGPLFGGFLVEHFGWQWIFLMNLPLGVLALTVIGLALKPQRTRQKHRIDYAGFTLLTGTLASFVIATSLGGILFPWNSVQIIGLIVLSILLLVGFILVELRAIEPVLPMGLFRNNTFVLMNAMGFLVGMAMFGCLTFVPLYLQVVKGISPAAAGVQMIPMMGALILCATLSGFFMSRTGRYKFLPVLSTVALALGLLLLGFVQVDTPDWQIALYMFLVGIGIGPVNSVSTTATQNAVPHEVVGVATASTNMFRQIGGSMGVSVFGAIFAAGLAAATGLSGGMGSLDSASIAALPALERAELLQDFASALHPVFFVAAGGAVIAFVLSLFLEELPLATSLRREPEAEIAAEEAAASAAVGGPSMPPELRG